MVLVLGGAFAVLHIGGALVHVWSIGWCLEVLQIRALYVYKCISRACKC